MVKILLKFSKAVQYLAKQHSFSKFKYLNPGIKGKHVKNIKNVLTPSELEALHWTTEIHEMTEELYGLQYDYEVTYGATNKSRP